MQKSRGTHFGQISVEEVKKMTHQFSGTGNTSVTDLCQRTATLHPPAGLLCRGILKMDTAVMDTSVKMSGLAAYPKDLRELALRIQEETDASQMIGLVQQLIAKFDERQIQIRGRRR
jgi:hypothetical protein